MQARITAMVEYECTVCEKKGGTVVEVGDVVPPPGPGWGVVCGYDGAPESVVCSPECYEEATGRAAGVAPVPEPGSPAEQLADVELVLESVAFDQRRSGEPVAAWLGRTLTAMGG